MMYVPQHFAEADRKRLVDLMRENSFALLTTIGEDSVPEASHLPLLYEAEGGPQGRLIGHMARANPQWRHFAAGRPALIVFAGAHAYISPSWYASANQVPTWNYAAVHAYGVPQIIAEEPRVLALLDRLVGTYEGGFAQPWRMERLADGVASSMSRGIVAFEIPLTRLEGKWKLGQNKSAADRRGAAEALDRLGGEDNRAIAALMRATL